VTVKNTAGCLACTKLTVELCDATCQADPTKTQHDVWRCDTGKGDTCAHTNPLTAAQTAWVKDVTHVAPLVTRASTSSKTADVSGKLYRVVEAVVDAAGTQEVDCVSYAEANLALWSLTFKAQLDVKPILTAGVNNYTATKWTVGKHRPVVYVAGPAGAGPQVRALTCTGATTCTGTTFTGASGAATLRPPSTAGDPGINAWTVEPRKHCRARATFAQRYPDCQQGLKSLLAKNAIVEAAGVTAEPAYLAWTVPAINKAGSGSAGSE